MKEYKIIDNFLSEKDANEIEKYFIEYLPWFYLGHTCEEDEIFRLKQKYENMKEFVNQFSHNFMYQYDTLPPSEHSHIIKAILDKMDKRFKILRIKSNLIPKDTSFKDYEHHCPHTDNDADHVTAIYYVNPSDGDTFLFLKEDNTIRVSPVKNRLLIFEGNILHAGASPRQNQCRMVINLNFKKI
tara:strand:+ start:3011 stop:3565 length:555 start_codon:yes stop_codon:yes gene_type:complete